jgi:hypothetical protein
MDGPWSGMSQFITGQRLGMGYYQEVLIMTPNKWHNLCNILVSSVDSGWGSGRKYRSKHSSYRNEEQPNSLERFGLKTSFG